MILWWRTVWFSRRNLLALVHRSIRLVLLVMLLAMVSTVGCKRSAPSAKSAVETTSIDEAEKKPDKTNVPPMIVEQVEPSSEDDQDLDSDENSPANKAENDDSESTTLAFEWPGETLCERLLLLMPGGPLVVDVWITIAGRPHREGFGEIVDAAWQAGDTNGDGRKTWKEWRANESYFNQLALQQPPSDRQLEDWVETYDQNKDRRIQRHEITAWLGRDAGRSAAALTLRSSRTRSAGGATGSRLWTLLDVDSSGGLSAQELERASRVLWSLDANDDRILVDSELATLEEQLAQDGTNRVRATRVRRRHAALHFGAHFDQGRLGYLLADMYSPRQSITPASFADLPELFEELDDGDEWLGDNDFARLATIEPHLRLALSFSDKPDEQAKIETMDLSPRAAKLILLAEPSPERVVLELGASRLVLSAHDLSGPTGTAEELRRSQTQLMVHDQGDAMFDFVDANSDGRLGEREVETAAERLLARDTDADGMVVGDNLPYTLVAAFQRGEDPSAKNFYVPDSPASRSETSEAPAWFTAADFNADGDLSPREFIGPPQAFDQLDANDDGFVDAAEAEAADSSASSAG